MSDPAQPGERSSIARPRKSRLNPAALRRRLFRIVMVLLVFLSATTACAGWVGSVAYEIQSQLSSATQIIPSIRSDLADNRPGDAAKNVERLRVYTAAAKEAADGPAWSLASNLPWVGQNFSAVTEITRTADDVTVLGLAPLVSVVSSLDWNQLLPSASGTDLKPLAQASPSITSAAHAVRVSADRLERIDASQLIPQVADPITEARSQLDGVVGTLEAAADASKLLPDLLGSSTPRSYLLMIQNNAEARASGGIPGALAVLNIDKGKLTLSDQSSASAVGVMVPTLPIDPEQRGIYSGRLGKFMQDVNLTPDFPTAAGTAQGMWERKTGQRVDGVISIDPVSLGYILDATGPVTIKQPEVAALAKIGLPTELSGKNVVQTLLADVYAKIEKPALQDAYFAGVAQEVFGALSDGKGNAKGLLEGLTRGTSEGRVLVWSGLPAEQSVIAKYAISGSIAGPSIAPAQFGAYFNDGTGAKMDYYVKRTVQLVKECSQNGYEQTTVRVVSTNTAPADAASSLPAYVTGGGSFGVPEGSVQTNIVAYGPIQSNVETAKLDGQRTEFAPYMHSNRPVGVVAIRLAPGESRSVEFTFGKIVQHTEPNLVVTPTVQNVNDVILPTQNAQCG